MVDKNSLIIERAELIKNISHPVRLCIVKGLLEKGKTTVSDMQNCLGVPQSTVSIHISKLRMAKIIEGERRGKEIYYYVSNELIKEIIKVLFN